MMTKRSFSDKNGSPLFPLFLQLLMVQEQAMVTFSELGMVWFLNLGKHTTKEV